MMLIFTIYETSCARRDEWLCDPRRRGDKRRYFQRRFSGIHCGRRDNKLASVCCCVVWHPRAVSFIWNLVVVWDDRCWNTGVVHNHELPFSKEVAKSTYCLCRCPSPPLNQLHDSICRILIYIVLHQTEE